MSRKIIHASPNAWASLALLAATSAQAIAAGTVQSLSAGAYHTCAVIDAEVWCWGHNEDGQLGDGTARNRHQPEKTRPMGQRMRQVSAGDQHSCAVSEQGDAWCWGGNVNGQVCNDCQMKSTSPGLEIQPIEGLEGKTRSISAKGLHTAAVVEDEIVVWGRITYQYEGEKYSPSPHGLVRVRELPGSAVSVQAGGYTYGPTTCSATSDGDVYCWGHGNGNTPRKIEGLPSKAVDAGSGERHACALLVTGAVYCWGSNHYGQLGAGTGYLGNEPVRVKKDSDEPLPVATQISVGVSHSCAVLEDATLGCWGSNERGKLGMGDNSHSSVFAQTVKLADWSPLSNVSMVSAGTRHTCASAEDKIYCWGSNQFGQLGRGRQDESYRFEQKVVNLVAGEAFGCVQLEDGSVDCWGGIPIQGRTHSSWKPVHVLGPDSNVDLVAAGGHHYPFFCFANSAVARCVGGLVQDFESRNNDIRMMSAGLHGVCLVDRNEIWCWGRAEEGAPEDIIVEGRPRMIEGIEGRISAIGAGGYHHCAIADGDVWCWGDNRSGQLGDGSFESSDTAVKVKGLDASAVGIASGSSYSCALLENKRVFCWGGIHYRRPAEERWHRSENGLAHEVIDLEAAPVSLAAGALSTCAILENGEVYCWGTNLDHELVPGRSNYSARPLKVEGLGSGAAAVAAGNRQACALSQRGEVRCWGKTGTRLQERADYSFHPLEVKFPARTQP